MIIYKATNLINNKLYIGKTVGPLYRRKYTHWHDAKRGDNIYFHRALLKYGKNNFKWDVLCKCDSRTKLLLLEKFYIAIYKKFSILYNMTDGGEGCIGLEKTAEHKRKISESHKGIRPTESAKEKIRNALLGNIPWNKDKKGVQISHRKGKTNCYTEETKKKMGAANIGKIPWNKGKTGYMISPMKGKKHKIESILKARESHTNKLLRLYNPEMKRMRNIGFTLDDIAYRFNCSQSYVCNFLRSKYKVA